MPQIEILPGPQDSRLQAEGSLGFLGPALEDICCHIAIVMDSGSPDLWIVRYKRSKVCIFQTSGKSSGQDKTKINDLKKIFRKEIY